MKLIRNAAAVGAIAAAALVACSTQTGSTGSGSNGGVGSLTGHNGDGTGTGTISMHLTIGSGVNLYALSYTCTGPSAIPAGTITFGDAQSVEYVLGGITAGAGYQCTLTGFDSAGDYCTGMTTSFGVTAGVVGNAAVLVTCTVATDSAVAATVTTGSTYFDAAVQLDAQAAYQCPGITAFSIIPAELQSSDPAQLSVTETGPTGLAADGGATTSDIIWTATCATQPCGTFNGQPPPSTAAAPTFQCGPTAEVVTITAQVTNYETTQTTGGPVTTDVCAGKPFTTMSSTINCEGGGTLLCFAPTNVNCSGTCTNLNNTPVDPANCGACGHTCTSPQVCVHNGATNTNACATPPPTICTAGQTPAANNCIICTNSRAAGNICTPTESVFVQVDLNNGSTTASGNAAGSCYACLLANTCLDKATGPVLNQECGDLATELAGGNFTNGSSTVVNAASTCVTTLTCEAGNACGNNANGISYCFCGSNDPVATTCAAVGSEASLNGACLSQEIAGFATTSANTTILNYTDTLEPSGLANSILACASSNGCTSCL